MFETDPEQNKRSGIQVLLGFLLGVVLSMACLFLSIFLGSTTAPSHPWLMPLFNAIGLIGAGVVAWRQVRESSFALGAVIAFAIALLLDGACAVVLWK
jgi:hypothetical protein